MSGALGRIGRVAVLEGRMSLRSRRALVVTLLFLAVSAGLMYAMISIFASLEAGLSSTLGLPGGSSPGAMAEALWKSKPFVRMMERMAGGSLVFADIQGRHPLLLAYAANVFFLVPLLTLLVSASSVANDVRSGAARFWLVRVTRTEWALGKFCGEALTVAGAMAVGALAAWGVMLTRLPFSEAVTMLPGLFDWMVRAFFYSLAWLGLFLGLSHVASSGGKATALGILALLGVAAWRPMLSQLAENVAGFAWVTHFDVLVPGAFYPLLWRRSPSALFQGVVLLSALAFLYLSLGAAVFRRRDV